MDPWNCCRTCLTEVESLYPIFQQTDQHEKYSEVIFSVTGLKVKFNDALPQEMCKTCIHFINVSYKFRKKCEENHKTLLSQVNDKRQLNIKIDSNIFNTENGKNITIDISDVNIIGCKTYNNHEDSSNDFDYDSEENNVKNETEIEMTVQDIIDKPIDRIFKNIINKNDYDSVKNNVNNDAEIEMRVQNIIDKPTERIFKNEYNSVENNVNNETEIELKVQDIIDKPVERIFKNKKSKNDYDSVAKNDSNIIEFETRVQDIVDKPVEIIFNKIEKIKNISKKPVRRSTRRKKETDTTKERAKEEIECEYCHKILTSKLSLRNHYKIHTGFDIICEHCGKKFITRRLLLMHCRAKHGYEKTDKCSYCDYKASNAEQVKIHERLHTGEKPFVCSVCGAGFHRKSSYLQHVAIHLPDKTVQCDQCPARFKSVTLMRIHKNRHKGPQYSFKCQVCNNNFSRRRNVVRHIQRIHAVTPSPQHIHRIKIT